MEIIFCFGNEPKKVLKTSFSHLKRYFLQLILRQLKFQLYLFKTNILGINFVTKRAFGGSFI